MPDELNVTQVLAGDLAPDVPGWLVEYREPDSTLRNFAFPQVAFEWRAAEYGLDDPEQILDVILHEHVARRLGNPQEPAVAPMIPAGQAATRARTAADEPPVTLWTADSTEQARDAHLETLAAVKEQRAIADPSGFLSYITADHGMTSAGILAKMEQVDTTRWGIRYGALPEPPRSRLLPMQQEG